MKRLLITLLLLTTPACVNGVSSTTIPDKTNSSVNNSDSKIIVPDIKDTFLIKKFDKPVLHTNISINNSGNGFIVFNNTLKRVENFNVNDSEITVNSENKGNSAIHIDDKGNGLLFLLPEQMSCLDIGNCKFDGSITSNKIENYQISEDKILVDSDKNSGLNGSSLALDIDQNNNGFLYWTKTINYPEIEVFARKIENLKLSGSNFDNKEALDFDSIQMTSLNNQGTGMKLIKKENKLYVQKIDKNMPVGSETLINDDNLPKYSAAISLNEQGSGLVVWTGGESNNYAIRARYIANFQPL